MENEETALLPEVTQVDLNMVGFQKGSGVLDISIDTKTTLSGEVFAKFAPEEPFKWLK